MSKTHRQKVKLARRMMTTAEIKNHTSIFDSVAWNQRKKAIIKRLAPKSNVGDK